MRKCLITPIPQDAPSLDEGWLNLDGVAVVEVTSEEKEYPVEAALVSGEMRVLHWRSRPFYGVTAHGSGCSKMRIGLVQTKAPRTPVRVMGRLFEQPSHEVCPRID